MALSTDNSFEATPAYIVYRDTSNGEIADPTSPLLFFPPKDSDELFDALRTAFPHLRTHSERMREAVIQFCKEEQEQELFQTSPALTMDTTPGWPSAPSSGTTSLFSSPDLLDLPSPTSFANSPQTQAPQLARTHSVATSSQASPPSLDQMTGVFSLSAEAQPKQRVRRKMTEAEKVEYRKRRIVKACDKCAKRKRKCPHNQAQMEVVQTSKSSAKVAKAVSRKSNFDIDKKGQNFAIAEPIMAAEDFDFTTGLDMSTFQSFDDFPMFEDQFPEFTVDDLMHFDQPANNFQPQDYFTTNLSPTQQNGSSGNEHYEFGLPQPHNPVQHVPGTSGDLQQLDTDHNLLGHGQDRSSISGSQQQPRRSGLRVSTGAETRNNVLLGVNHQQDGLLLQGDLQNGRQDGQQNVPGNGMLWEHLRTGQRETPQPTHTAHVHNAGCGELFGLAEANGVLKEPRLRPTLAQTTSRLVGTTKALRTFAGLAQSSDSRSPSRSQSISIQRVVEALRHATEHQLSTSNGSTPLPVQHTRPHSGTSSLTDSALRKSSSTGAPDRREGLLAHPTANAVQPELRLQTSTSVSQSGGLRIGTAALSQGRPHLSLVNPDHGIQQSLLASKSISGIASSVPRQPGRRPTTLGEGVAPLSSISSELFMARRRIPRKPGTNQNHQHTTKVKVESGQLAAQANGGAYPRLQPRDSHAASNDSGRTPAIAATPASIVGNHAVNDARAIDRSMAAQGAFTFTPGPEQARASYHMLCRDHHGREPQQDRLRDYFKVKDHRGRSPILAVVATLALVAMLFAGNLPAVAFSAVCYFSFFSFEKEEIVQCTEANSSWLVNIAQRTSKSELFSPKKGKKVGGASNVNEAWLKGLMYPFAYSPLRFATMV